MEIFTLSIAILCLLLATLPLGWQIAAWAMDGPRLRTTFQHGLFGSRGSVVSTVLATANCATRPQCLSRVGTVRTLSLCSSPTTVAVEPASQHSIFN